MSRHQPRYEIWLFVAPALVHMTWAVAVLRSASPLITTGLADIYKIMHYNRLAVGLSLLLFALMAIGSVFCHRSHPRLSFMLLLPQQFLMLLSLITATECMIMGRFANGVVLGSDFIIADQCHQAFIPFAHTCLIFHVYLWDGFKCWCNNKRTAINTSQKVD